MVPMNGVVGRVYIHSLGPCTDHTHVLLVSNSAWSFPHCTLISALTVPSSSHPCCPSLICAALLSSMLPSSHPCHPPLICATFVLSRTDSPPCLACCSGTHFACVDYHNKDQRMSAVQSLAGWKDIRCVNHVVCSCCLSHLCHLSLCHLSLTVPPESHCAT